MIGFVFQFSFFWYVGSHGNVAVAVLVTVPVTLTATTTLQRGGRAWAVVTATKKNCAVVTAGKKYIKR